MPNKSKNYASKFNVEWLQLEKLKKWLKPVDGDVYSGWCTLCQKPFDVRRTSKDQKYPLI